jgi:hypothetical protein
MTADSVLISRAVLLETDDTLIEDAEAISIALAGLVM